MTRFTIEVSDKTAHLLSEMIKLANEANTGRKGRTSHGALTIESMFAMLADDFALALTRPATWEGIRVLQALSSHGYDIF